MNCLIISATPFEIAPLLEQYKSGQNWPSHVNADILITGIGLVASTHSLTRQIMIKRPDLIIQAGIAGCFDHSVLLGSVFAISHDRMADLGVMEKGVWKGLSDLQLVSPDQTPYTKNWLVNKSDILKKIKLKKVKAVSVNEISSQPKRIALYREQFNPVLESMEGAALHYVAVSENIPFVQLRSVSNYVGERNKKKWKIKESIVNLNIAVANLLNTL